jgi:hypothetical protein
VDDEEENEVNDLDFNINFIDKTEKNNFNKIKNSDKFIENNNYDNNYHKNNKDNFQSDLKNQIKSISFNSKIFLQNRNFQSSTTNSETYSGYAYTFKNSTPSYCKEDINKILKNMKISPVNNPNISSSNVNEIIKKTANDYSDSSTSNDCILKGTLEETNKKLDLFRKSSITTTNSVSTSNSLGRQSEKLEHINPNNNANSESCYNLSANLNKNSGKIFINNTTKNNAILLNKINFNFSNKAIDIAKISYANNFKNTNIQNVTTPDSTKMQYFRNFNQALGFNKAKNNLNKLNELKKGHLKTISINISSVQSPEHKAIYKIENIEQCQNIGFPKLDSNLKSKMSFTPTSLQSAKNKIMECISPKKIKALPKSTKVCNTPIMNNNNNYNNNNAQLLNSNQKKNDSEINNFNKHNEESLIVRFLIEKYGLQKYSLIKNANKKNEDYNKNDDKSKQYFIDEDMIRSIVGEEELKITMNYMKYFKPLY